MTAPSLARLREHIEQLSATWCEFATHLPDCEIRRKRACSCGYEEAVLRTGRIFAALLADTQEPPAMRDNDKPNRPHEFDQDPETGCCVVCGWAEACHNFADTQEPEPQADPLLVEMRRISAAVDSASGPSEYNARLVALALVARQFLRRPRHGHSALGDLADELQVQKMAEGRAPEDEQPRRELRILTCKRCGCAIDAALCGYECDLDGLVSNARDNDTMEVRVYRFVRSEPLPTAAPRQAQEPAK